MMLGRLQQIWEMGNGPSLGREFGLAICKIISFESARYLHPHRQ